jgi:hypothetical protein
MHHLLREQSLIKLPQDADCLGARHFGQVCQGLVVQVKSMFAVTIEERCDDADQAGVQSEQYLCQ